MGNVNLLNAFMNVFCVTSSIIPTVKKCEVRIITVSYLAITLSFLIL